MYIYYIYLYSFHTSSSAREYWSDWCSLPLYIEINTKLFKKKTWVGSDRVKHTEHITQQSSPHGTGYRVHKHGSQTPTAGFLAFSYKQCSLYVKSYFVLLRLSNLTPPDGMIRIGSAFTSGIVPLESLWEGAKNTGCWLDKPSAYVGDWRAKSTNQINEAYDVITECRGKLVNYMSVQDLCRLCNANLRLKASSAAFYSSFREGILSNSAKTCSIAARISITSAEAAMLKSRPSLRHTLTRLKTNADWPIIWWLAPNYFCRAMPVWTVSGISWSSRDQAGLTRLEIVQLLDHYQFFELIQQVYVMWYFFHIK